MGTSIFNKYHPATKFENLRVLNAGCGFDQFRTETVVNVDLFDVCKPDLVWDLNTTPLPFPDNHFDLIIANHILEHLENWWDFFGDCARMLKQNGTLQVWVPGNGTDSIFGYRDHIHQINNCSFFGIFHNYRYGGNAWAEEHAINPALWLKLVNQMAYMENYWWLWKWPFKKLQWWAHQHLRNVVSEQAFFFRKVTTEEFTKEMERYRHERQRREEQLERDRNSSPVPLSLLRKTGV